MTEDLQVTIRPASGEDAQSIRDIYAPFVTHSVVSFEEEPPSVDEMARRVADSHVWLAAEDASGLCGYAYAARFHPRPAYRWSTEISVYLAPNTQGRGVGRRLLGDLLERLVASGFVNAFAGTTLPNRASVALFESFGFEKIAHQRNAGYKLGAWHDVGWWQLQLRDPPVPPSKLS